MLSSAQEFPSPVFLRITPEGKVEQQTANTHIPCSISSQDVGYSVKCEALSLCTHHNTTDSSLDVTSGYSGNVNLTQFTLQNKYVLGTIYPEVPSPGFEMPWLLTDTTVVRTYFVSGYTCSNGGEYRYTVEQDWRLDRDHRVSVIYVTQDSNTTVWKYTYHPDGRLQNLLLIREWGYETKYYDTTSTELVYDELKRCVAICNHSGLPYVSIRDAIAQWKQQLDSAFTPGEEPDRQYEYGDIRLYELVVYSYSGNLLTSTLAYNEGLSAVFSDSLYYDAKGQLVCFRSFIDDDLKEILFTYDKKGRVISKSEKHFWQAGNRDNSDLEVAETYTYGKQGRMTGISYFYSDETYPNKVTVNIYYPRQ